MKKQTIIILVSLCLVLALAATLIFFLVREKADGGEAPDDPPVDHFDNFVKLVGESDPTAYDCDISYETGSLTLHGRYLMLFAEIDGKRCAKLTYEYDKLNEIGESDDLVSTLTGTLYAKGEDDINELISSASGAYTGDAEVRLSVLTLEKSMFETYNIVEKNEITMLTGTLKEGALGESASDVSISLEVSKEQSTVSRLSLGYTDAYGAKVSAIYLFSYEAQNFEIE